MGAKSKKRKIRPDQQDIDFLDKLVIGIGELSETTGIPIRRIRYLEEAGAINVVPGSRPSTRRFDYPNIRRMVTLQELVAEGYSLKGAMAKLDALGNPERRSK